MSANLDVWDYWLFKVSYFIAKYLIITFICSMIITHLLASFAVFFYLLSHSIFYQCWVNILYIIHHFYYSFLLFSIDFLVQLFARSFWEERPRVAIQTSSSPLYCNRFRLVPANKASLCDYTLLPSDPMRTTSKKKKGHSLLGQAVHLQERHFH